MKLYGVKRAIDELGRVVIPKDLRKSLGIGPKDMLNIGIDGNRIVLEKAEDICAVCGNKEDLTEVDGSFVCGACIRRIRNLEP